MSPRRFVFGSPTAVTEDLCAFRRSHGASSLRLSKRLQQLAATKTNGVPSTKDGQNGKSAAHGAVETCTENLSGGRSSPRSRGTRERGGKSNKGEHSVFTGSRRKGESRGGGTGRERDRERQAPIGTKHLLSETHTAFMSSGYKSSLEKLPVITWNSKWRPKPFEFDASKIQSTSKRTHKGPLGSSPRRGSWLDIELPDYTFRPQDAVLRTFEHRADTTARRESAVIEKMGLAGRAPSPSQTNRGGGGESKSPGGGSRSRRNLASSGDNTSSKSERGLFRRGFVGGETFDSLWKGTPPARQAEILGWRAADMAKRAEERQLHEETLHLQRRHFENSPERLRAKGEIKKKLAS
uniref:Uncharacterized protein n=1 Tax=Chromera velia CCMP2878 TaxID=1169474 RepID=A0A0G4I9D5_9ALVE|eukprot:Cvel_2041.t1-p1 / transcript=Cvel_2041.t1 / gene=Cvel_2041 / organism=Chromera_velia_CCMP2878 / gene_product=hypothetical protein / transcript_product=hypothetical protein / location=Cvel_scaffold78:99344-104443(+) / protein_length=351 / sequence_SO=supercontig / SO=protein_coding / is_pseudo=false